MSPKLKKHPVKRIQSIDSFRHERTKIQLRIFDKSRDNSFPIGLLFTRFDAKAYILFFEMKSILKFHQFQTIQEIGWKALHNRM